MSNQLDTENVSENVNYWNTFYLRDHVETPSQFCVSVCTEIQAQSIIIELGSGSGRDAFFFARSGHHVVGIDLSEQAIHKCKQRKSQLEFQHVDFIQGDLERLADLKAAVALSNNTTHDSRGKIYYSRFVMHSLSEAQESNFFDALSEVVKQGDSLYFEFRSKEDQELKKHYGGHYRRFIDSENFAERLKKKLGLIIEYIHIGRGMAKFRDEDPVVCRIIARKV